MAAAADQLDTLKSREPTAWFQSLRDDMHGLREVGERPASGSALGGDAGKFVRTPWDAHGSYGCPGRRRRHGA